MDDRLKGNKSVSQVKAVFILIVYLLVIDVCFLSVVVIATAMAMVSTVFERASKHALGHILFFFHELAGQ